MTAILVAVIVSKHVIRAKHGRDGSVWLTRVVQAKHGRTESVWLVRRCAEWSYVDCLSCQLWKLGNVC